ncbi:MAG: YvcK family protein [bacterium]|nr:YvcK family protein [bacterium]MDO8581600.1 YvcK family protein [bacterium]
MKKIVVIGGGTGTAAVLRGLKEYPVDCCAILTTADDGGSSGILRVEYNMIPPGDARQCLVALADSSNVLASYMHERFHDGSFAGHPIGNLLIASVFQRTHDFVQSLSIVGTMLSVRGRVLPVTLQPTMLHAYLKDGRVLSGEEHITTSKEIVTSLQQLRLTPASSLLPEARVAIMEADMIIIGSGNFFSSIMPSLLVSDMPETLRASKAKKVYIANCMTQNGHTDHFTLDDFLQRLSMVLGKDIFDHIIYNTSPLPSTMKNIGDPIHPTASLVKDSRIIGMPLLDPTPVAQHAADRITRSIFRHDSKKIAEVIMGL